MGQSEKGKTMTCQFCGAYAEVDLHNHRKFYCGTIAHPQDGQCFRSNKCEEEHARKIRDCDRWRAYAEKLEEWGDYKAQRLQDEWWVENWNNARKGKP